VHSAILNDSWDGTDDVAGRRFCQESAGPNSPGPPIPAPRMGPQKRFASPAITMTILIRGEGNGRTLEASQIRRGSERESTGARAQAHAGQAVPVIHGGAHSSGGRVQGEVQQVTRRRQRGPDLASQTRMLSLRSSALSNSVGRLPTVKVVNRGQMITAANPRMVQQYLCECEVRVLRPSQLKGFTS
jgi:hypothetical protein